MYFDWTIILLIPAMILSVYAQAKVNSAYGRFAQVANGRRITGAEAARRILDSNGLQDVQIEHVQGRLSDHYDPRSRVMRLSDSVYGDPSIASISIAAHESGHAIQHATGYGALSFRNGLAPVARISSNMAWPLALIGLLLGSATGWFLFDLGLILYAVAVLFQVVTLPVELDASKRALVQLDQLGMLTGEEEHQNAKKMLSAAALTYVAAMAVAVLNLLRLLLIRGRQN